MTNKLCRVGALKLLATCALCLGPAASVQAVQLMGYTMEGTVSTANGPGVPDISGLGTALDATLVGQAAVVADATRPGGGAGNMVLYTGTLTNGLTGAATAGNHPGLGKLNTLGSMTLATWIKGTGTGGFRQVFGRGHQGERLMNFGAAAGNEDTGWAISNSNLGGFQFSVADTTPNINDGAWHHFAVSFNAPAQTVTTYFDGAVAQVTNVGFNARVSVGGGAGVGIGMRFDADAGSGMPNHYLDDAFMWDEAADPAKIALIASGAASSASFANIGVIPEPATAALAAMAMVGLAVLRRRG